MAGDTRSSAEYWDDRYRSVDRVWSGQPNCRLVAEVAGMAPGRALDVGCGEGADAFWLAGQGWSVTAVDISSVGLDRARRFAAEHGDEVAGRITWVQADLLDWSPEPGTYDLISAQFMHLPAPERDDLHRRLAAGVAPGGILLLVGHHPSDLATGLRRPQGGDRLFTAEHVVGLLGPGWTILTQAAQPRPATRPDGRAVTIHDTVVTARRD